MPSTRGHAGRTGVGERIMTRWREWWARDELVGLDRNELDRIAGEFSMSAVDLEDLAARGSRAVAPLNERMEALGITRAHAEHVAQGAMRDLERTCARCRDKGICERDLAAHPDDPAWEDYCPNAVTLKAIKDAKG